jgi:hypothetical protein
MEFIVILAIALGVLIPAVLFFSSYSKTSQAGSTNAHLNDVGLQMVAAVKNTYSLGLSARQTVEFSMPEEVRQVYVDNYELVFVYETPQGMSRAVFYSPINMSAPDDPSASNTCTLIAPNADGNLTAVHPGITKFRITMAKASPPTVCIDETF